jgi:hypothetical protein
MIQITASHPDRSNLKAVRGHAPAPIRSMNLQIALRRTTAGVAHSEAEIGECFFFSDRLWCP